MLCNSAECARSWYKIVDLINVHLKSVCPAGLEVGFQKSSRTITRYWK